MNLVAIVRVLGLLIIARFLMSFLKHLVAGYKGAAAAGAPAGAAPAQASELVRDRICNTFLPRERAIHALVNGQEEHFCSVSCRDRALLLQPAH
jgi:hypothetical protein